jgi:anaerobic magnesium-protoporphyrin IX monomethyl ester cyclase
MLKFIPFICTLYVGSPLFYDNQDFVLQQYDERLKLVFEGKAHVDNEIVKKWK